jgi:hypothetical protein
MDDSENEPARYWYTLIRWVPNPARGEFVNIGVVTFSDSDADGSGVYQRTSHLARANRLGKTPEDMLSIIERMMGSMWITDPEARYGVAMQMNHDHRNLIQFTQPLPIVAKSTAAAMDFIFPKLVGDE